MKDLSVLFKEKFNSNIFTVKVPAKVTILKRSTQNKVKNAT